MAEPVDRDDADADTRGILDPRAVLPRIALTRSEPPPELVDVVDRFWGVEWDLPAGERQETQVLTHPGLNVSVGHAPDDGPVEARVYGVERDLSVRVLVGAGWNVAAMTRPGGFGALCTVGVATLTDRVVPLGPVLGIDEDCLVARLGAAADQEARVSLLADALLGVLAAVRRTDPQRLEAARLVTSVSRLAETDRTVSTVEDLASYAGLSPRTLQRLFRTHAGVSPLWVVRRYRLLDAAELVRDGREVVWADVAARLGYADQAHLVRDFRAALGTTPAAYAAAQRGPTPRA